MNRGDAEGRDELDEPLFDQNGKLHLSFAAQRTPRCEVVFNVQSTAPSTKQPRVAANQRTRMPRTYQKKAAPTPVVRAVDVGVAPRAVSPLLKLAIASSSLSLSLALAGAGCAHSSDDAQLTQDAVSSLKQPLGANTTAATGAAASATAFTSATATGTASATATTPIAPVFNHGRTAGVPAGTAPPVLPTAHPPQIRGKIAMPHPTPSSAPTK